MIPRSFFLAGACGLVLAGLPAQGPTKDFWTTPPTHEAVLSSQHYEASIATCLGGTQAWFTSNRPGNGGYDIYYATRATSTAPWGTPVLSALSTSASESYIDISEDGLEIFISHAPASNQAHDLSVCLRTSTAVDFAPANQTLIAGANTASDEGDPTISANYLSLYFQSDRTGGQQNAIWRVTRPNRGAPFGNPQLMSDSPLIDHSPSISASDNFLMASVTAGGSASDLHQKWRLDGSQTFATGQGTLVVEFTTPTWEANGQYERYDSEYWMVSDYTVWGGASSDVYSSQRMVPGLAANVNSVSASSGGTIVLNAAENATLSPVVHIYYGGFSLLSTAQSFPGIAGELAINPLPIFQIGASVPTDGVTSQNVIVPPGLPSGARLHFQVLRVVVAPVSIALSIHESVGIQ